jgi:branched-chain amino acid transport system ATP-binding protein
MPNAEVILHGREINCYYARSHVVLDFDIEIARGEFVALIGRNGMGKTSLLKGIMGLIERRVTTLTLGTEDISQADTYVVARRGLQLIPEGRGTFYNLTVGEQLNMCATLGGTSKTGLGPKEVLALFPQLAERCVHFGDQLSGGEQQMLTIARALLLKPICIMIDEATEGLAPLISAQIWKILARIKALGVALIVVDKNISELSTVADRFVIVERGQKVFDGSKESFMTRRDELNHFLTL